LNSKSFVGQSRGFRVAKPVACGPGRILCLPAHLIVTTRLREHILVTASLFTFQLAFFAAFCGCFLASGPHRLATQDRGFYPLQIEGQVINLVFRFLFFAPAKAVALWASKPYPPHRRRDRQQGLSPKTAAM